jgi:hypothetical protein
MEAGHCLYLTGLLVLAMKRCAETAVVFLYHRFVPQQKAGWAVSLINAEHGTKLLLDPFSIGTTCL